MKPNKYDKKRRKNILMYGKKWAWILRDALRTPTVQEFKRRPVQAELEIRRGHGGIIAKLDK